MSEDSNFKEIKIKKPKFLFEITKPVNSKIIEGDCFTVMDEMIKNETKFDLIFADPPYFLSNGVSHAIQERWLKWTKVTGMHLKDLN